MAKIERYHSDFLADIVNADMVLVGIGKEFDDLRNIKTNEKYIETKALLESNNALWLLPALEDYFREDSNVMILKVLNKLAELLEKKNYFVVSTSTNGILPLVNWKEGRFVMPCGSIHKKQCVENCKDEVYITSNRERDVLHGLIEKMIGNKQFLFQGNELGNCKNCQAGFVINSIYADNYSENGYLPDWEMYRKWLQGTLNKKLLVLELGVGLQFPSVIRWPFEKIASLNQKAKFYRINEKLYQLTEELSEKGIAISENAIDWLKVLC